MKDLSKPPWLNKEFLVHVLQSKAENSEQLQVLNWQCTAAVPPGSNYLSNLYRVRVDYQADHTSKTASLIIKTPLAVGQVREFVDSVGGYEREVQIYNQVLPHMNKLSSTRVGPTAYVCPLQNTLALEDLGEQGYKMANRLKQLDVAHCKQFLEVLAKFHALSVAVHHENPSLIETTAKQIFYIKDAHDKEKQKAFLDFGLKAMLKTVEELDECKRFVDLIHNCIDNFYEKMVDIFNDSTALNVMNHGDCWTANVMFKYNDSGVPIDAKLLDFQISRLGSFAQDVIHFWWTSANEEVRENHREVMFEVYRKTLNKTLEELKCEEKLTKEQFNDELKRFAPFTLQIISGLLTITMADPEDLTDFNEFKDDVFDAENEQLTKNFQSKYYKAVLPNILRQAEAFGAFT